MILLKNKREWKKWAKNNETASAPFNDAPHEYPCYAYTTVLSYALVEDQPRYLYASDVTDMCMNLVGAAITHVTARIGPGLAPSSYHHQEPPIGDKLGRRVREVWIAWATEQHQQKPSWLLPFDQLTEPQKDVDRRIGLALWGDFVMDNTEALADFVIKKAKQQGFGTKKPRRGKIQKVKWGGIL